MAQVVYVCVLVPVLIVYAFCCVVVVVVGGGGGGLVAQVILATINPTPGVVRQERKMREMIMQGGGSHDEMSAGFSVAQVRALTHAC